MMNTNDVGFIPEAIMADKADTTTLYEFGRDGYAVGRVLETAAIAASGNPGGLDTLASRLVDEDPIVRYWAATGCRILEGRAAPAKAGLVRLLDDRSEEHTSELQSLMRNSYAVFCLKKKKK